MKHLFLILGLCSVAHADDRVAWLKKNASPIAHLDIEKKKDTFADLKPFGDAVGNARVVFLGEQTHGDGTTFEAKNRLIRYLHEEKGFTVLAFESGMYDCHVAWEKLRSKAHDEPRESVEFGVFKIWTRSQSVQPLIQYLDQSARGKPPYLELCGFDCQFTGTASSTELGGEIISMIGALPKDTIKLREADAIVSALSKAVEDEKLDKEQRALFKKLQKALMDAKPTKETPAEKLAWWRQMMENIVGEIEEKALPKELAEKLNHRDQQMAKNFLWLLEHRYPKQKVIVWAASYHTMREPKEIDDPDSKPSKAYADTITFGHDVCKVLKDEVYSVAFTAAEGEWKLVQFPRANKLKAPAKGSLEDLFVQAGCDNAFLDFRKPAKGGEWLNEKQTMRPLGYGNMISKWPTHFDGVVFTKTMKPSVLIEMKEDE
jgi:erythromycin esterase